jgi:uncharacterized protein (TIGR02284 family)
MGTKSSVDRLNGYLRGEMSAVETYKMALDKLETSSPLRAEIENNMMSHQDRVDALSDAIIAIGGKPATGSGPWGVWAKTVEGTAKMFGDKAAISALEEGEDHGLKDYKRGLDDDDLDGESRSLLTSRLLPEQQQTHDRMSALKHRIKK